jgi:pimeloyl-ACP methyl ester carboxylesterase
VVPADRTDPDSTARRLCDRRLPGPPLVIGPGDGRPRSADRFPPPPSRRTNLTLERYDLATLQGESLEHKYDIEETLQRLMLSQAGDPDMEKLYGIAELAYLDGQRQQALAHRSPALDRYGVAVVHIYWYLFDPQFQQSRNPYDSRFHKACELYNKSLEAMLRLIRQDEQLHPGTVRSFAVGTHRFSIEIVNRGRWADGLERLEFVSDFDVQSLAHRHRSEGLGVPMVGFQDSSNRRDLPGTFYYPPTMAFPVTAFLRVPSLPPAAVGSEDWVTHCQLELHDPLKSTHTHVLGRPVMLGSDISVPLAFQLDNPAFRERNEVATLGLFRPGETETGLFMLEPYDAEKIPVILVHGLFSSPLTWMDMYNDLRSFQEIRDRYQFWFYLYPTGHPFWITAAQLRKSLADVHQDLDPEGQNEKLSRMVLIGHSMGGLISLMQTIDPGEEIWHLVSHRPFDQLRGPPDLRNQLSSIVFFSPNRSVHRVITMATPFQGSRFANDYTRWLGQKIIELPAQLIGSGEQLIHDNPGFFHDTELLTTTTSIDSLSADSPIFPVLGQARLAPWVRYHNIAGQLPGDSLVGKISSGSDGLVSQQSSHFLSADSEIVVESDHLTIHRKPRTILEVRRILLLEE